MGNEGYFHSLETLDLMSGHLYASKNRAMVFIMVLRSSTICLALALGGAYS